MTAPEHLLLTCEHGGQDVPRAYRRLFTGRRALLHSHRGWDPGALLVARSLARALQVPLLAATTTRLLVDLNRSPHNPAVFSELTRGLSRPERQALLERHHRPHWERVRAAVADGRTLHVAVHSFTPVLRGAVRRFSVGLLYDPARRRERGLAAAWQQRLQQELGPGQVRRNAPYRGADDGLTRALRREFGEARYLGIELELNQRHLARPGPRRALVAALVDTLRSGST